MLIGYLFLAVETILQRYLLSLFLFSFGCKHRIRVESTPPGAKIFLKEKELGDTPVEHSLLWWPGRKYQMSIKLPGYRNMDIHPEKALSTTAFIKDLFMFRYSRLLGLKPRRTFHVLLIRDHGKAGTWSPKDAKKLR